MPLCWLCSNGKEYRTSRICTSSGVKSPIGQWLSGLRDAVTKTRIEKRFNQLAEGNFGDSRSIREGVIELRVHAGPGYRIYLGRQGQELVFLLAGGDKSTQGRDIELALRYWQDWKTRGTS